MVNSDHAIGISTRFARKKFLKSLVRLQYDAEISYSQEGIPWWLQAIAGVGLTGAALWHAAVVWAYPPTETPTQSGG